MVKDCVKVVCITAVGGITAILIYPLLHEVGHAAAAAFFGGAVKEIHVFPEAYVVCDMSDAGIFGKIAVGLGGMLLPFFLSAVAGPKKFWGWYVCFITRGVCMLSFGISSVAVMMFHFGREMENEDIVQVLRSEPALVWFCFVGALVLLACDMILVVRSHPIRQFSDYFEVA